MAAALLQRRLDLQGAHVIVTSAGTRSVNARVDPKAVAVMAERGIDIRRHVPRMTTSQVVEEAGSDLVLTMTAAQVRDVAVLTRSAFNRTFAFREAVRRSRYVSRPEPPFTDESALSELGAWTAALGEGRVPRDLLRKEFDDDIADPYSLSVDEVRRTADELDELALVLAGSAPWPTVASTSSVQP